MAFAIYVGIIALIWFLISRLSDDGPAARRLHKGLMWIIALSIVVAVVLIVLEPKGRQDPVYERTYR